MPVSGMNVGNDYTFVFFDGTNQNIVSLGDVQTLKKSAMKHDIESRPYNNDPKFGYIPDGYRFSFTVVRTDNQLEVYQNNNNVLFDSGANLIAGYLNETVNEADGTVTRWQYSGSVMWISDEGDVTRESNIKLTGEIKSSKKTRLA